MQKINTFSGAPCSLTIWTQNKKTLHPLIFLIIYLFSYSTFFLSKLSPSLSALSFLRMVFYFILSSQLSVYCFVFLSFSTKEWCGWWCHEAGLFEFSVTWCIWMKFVKGIYQSFGLVYLLQKEGNKNRRLRKMATSALTNSFPTVSQQILNGSVIWSENVQFTRGC